MAKVKKTNKIAAYAASLALMLISTALALFLGAGMLSPKEVINALFGMSGGSAAERIIFYVRLPRLLGALVSGAALAVSGAVIQGVLSNRLASPSIIGVNSGAGLAVTAATAMGILGGWRLSFIAFIGAFITVLFVSVAAERLGASKGTVILLGVAINSLLGAISDCIVTLFPEIGISRNDFRIGDFSSVTYLKLIPSAVIAAIAITALITLSTSLDVLTLGEETAKGLGMNTRLVRTILLLLAALLSGAAVSICGLLSFVGLIIPNAIRRVSGSGARHLLPLCGLFGGGFVALCDTLARVIFSPYEIPVGIIMAFLGAPFFVFILVKRRRDGL